MASLTHSDQVVSGVRPTGVCGSLLVGSSAGVVTSPRAGAPSSGRVVRRAVRQRPERSDVVPERVAPDGRPLPDTPRGVPRRVPGQHMPAEPEPGRHQRAHRSQAGAAGSSASTTGVGFAVMRPGTAGLAEPSSYRTTRTGRELTARRAGDRSWWTLQRCSTMPGSPATPGSIPHGPTSRRTQVVPRRSPGGPGPDHRQRFSMFSSAAGAALSTHPSWWDSDRRGSPSPSLSGRPRA